MTRFAKLERDQMTSRQQEVADAIASGPRGALKGPFLALIHNPDLAGNVQALGEYLRFRTKLPPRLLEVGILVTARRWSSDYEWAAHSRIAREAGLEDEVVEAIAKREKPGLPEPEIALIYDFATETVWNGCPSDASFDALLERYDLSTALDLMALCGYYTLLAFVLNAAQFPLPAGASPLPKLDERGSK